MSKSEEIYDQLCRLTPGGVNSPFRAFHLVGGKSKILVRGEGSRVWDADGAEYIDLCCGWGPLTLGHCHPKITEAVVQAAKTGMLFGAPTPWELDMALAVQDFLPSMEMIRFVNTGAEAVMSALRVARSVTSRSKILKFEGCYHGHVAPLDAVGQEADESGGPQALGTTPATTQDTLLARFNDLKSVETLFEEHPEGIACVILEPVTGSMGVIPAHLDFLRGLRELCDEHGCILIFDEVLTGFRVHSSAQKLFGVRPDLTCLGKAVAGGLAVGAYGGRSEFMKKVSPLGPIYQAGTFAGNPVTMRAGLAAMAEYRSPHFFEELTKKTEYLCSGLRDAIPGVHIAQVGGMFSIGFGVTQLIDHRDAFSLDDKVFAKFFHAALAEGIYLPPSTWDSASISSAHTYSELDEVIKRAKRAAKALS